MNKISATSFFLITLCFLISLISFFTYVPKAQAFTTVTWTGNANTTSWGTAGNWDTNSVPDANSDVVIGDYAPNTKQPTLGTNTTVNSVTINGKTASGNRGGCLTVSTGVTLTVTANVVITGATNTGGGATNCGGTSKREGIVTTTTGAVTVGGNLTMTNGATTGAGGEQPTIVLGSGGTLKLAGTSTIGTLAAFSVTAGIVNYTGGSQTVAAQTYGSLTLSGSGTKTLTSVTTINSNFTLSGTVSATTAANMTVGGNLLVRDGTSLTVAGNTFAVTGTTTVGEGGSGTLTFSSATNPNKTFTGLVTVNTGGTWNETAAITPTFGNGITNNGTFTSSTGVHTFATNNQELRGLHSVPSMTITAITVTNYDTLTVATALAGTGTLVNAASGTLNIGGTSTITSLTASASGNTVNYNGSGDQTIHNNSYSNLNLTGSGTKSAAGGMTIGNISITSGVTFDAKTFTHNITGDWSNAGTFTASTSTINFNGASQTINNANTWYNLSVTGTTARTVTFQAGVLQNVTNSLTLTGSSGNLLTLKSSSNSTKWKINAPSTQSINYTFPTFSDASGATTVNAGGGTGNIDGSNNINWDFGASAPTVTNISPSSGTELGGTSITISGTNFTAGATVTVGGVFATSINIVNSTTITATTPAGTVGVADVVITTSGGAGLPSGFTYLSHSASLSFTVGTGTSLAGVVVTDNTTSQNGADESQAKPLSVTIANTNKSAAVFNPVTTNATVTAYADNGTGGGSYSAVAANYNFSGTNSVLWIKVVSQDTQVTQYYKLSVTVAGILSTDATLNRTASTVKGETPSSLGTANATLSSAVAGAATISYAESLNTSNTGSYITLFSTTNGGATKKVVKYATDDSSAGFETATAYANQVITNQDYFIIKVTAQDTTTILYYKVVVTVLPPPLSSDATLNRTSTTIKGVNPSTLGTSNATLTSASGGAITLTSTQAADTSNTGSFITLFSATDANATIFKAVKYSSASTASSANFLSNTAYANEAISNNDYFIVEVDAQDGSILYYKIIVTVSASNDATLTTSATVKGVTVTSLGTPNATLSSASAGSVSISSTQAANTSNSGSFITLFSPTNAGGTTKVVKYTSGASTASFSTDSAYGNQSISNNDFFIIRVTAADSTTILYYKITVTISTYVLTYSAGSNGSITGTTSQTVSNGGNGSAVNATPSTGYHFVNWSDASTSNPRTDTTVTQDISVTANFAINTYTLNYSAGSNGSLTGITSQTVNYGSNGSAVTAVPASHYHFVNWSDSSASNPRTDTTVTSDKTLTANFAIDTYTLTYSAESHGSLTGFASQTINYGSDGTSVTAVADSGYAFLQWSDNSTTNPRQDTTITSNLNVSASFTNTRTISNPNPSAIQTQVSRGFIAVGSGNASNTNNFTPNVNLTFTSGNHSVVLPSETVGTKRGGGNFDFTAFTLSDDTSTAQSTLPTTISSIQVGIPTINLDYSQNVTLTIYVGSSYNGQTLTVYYQAEGSSSWNTETSCTISSGNCRFQTNHATSFAVTENESSPTPTPTPTPMASINSSSTNVLAASTTSSGCTDLAPIEVPDLFRIDVSQNKATLNFRTSNGASGYQIAYGLTPEANQFGDTFNYIGPLWILSHSINNLANNTTYYFKVKAVSGCAGGNFSKTVLATTKPTILEKTTQFVSQNATGGINQAADTISQLPIADQIIDKKLEVKKVEETTKPSGPNIISYIVQKGDTLWSIASKILGEGKKFSDIIAQNKDLLSKKIAVGQKLDIEKPHKPEEKTNADGYNLDLKILADSGQPLIGAKVTLHSTPRETVTNTQGVAHFSNVESGKHQVFIAYNGYNGGGHAINITGDNKNIEFTMQIQLINGFNSYKVTIIFSILVLIILVLVYLHFIRGRKLQRVEI